MKILIWHLHGSYLYYLTCALREWGHIFYVPSKPDRSGDYIGRWGHIPWPENLIDVPAQEVKNLDLDCVIFQQPRHCNEEQFEILSPEQRQLPKIYIEHDPPQENPTEQKHWIQDPAMLLVHVTHFNRLMWNSGVTPTRVVEHGVSDFPERYSGELERGLVVVNHLKRRGRRLGSDVFEEVRGSIPLDLVGMAAEESQGLGEVRHDFLPAFSSRYRFFFNPIRYTSLGLAVCEAMMIGLPILGLATTEMASIIQNGKNGYIETDVHRLMEHMRRLLKNPDEAKALGEGARRTALERFNLRRFGRDWNRVIMEAAAQIESPADEEPLLLREGVTSC